jgi:histidine triad (HIT) family protein
MSSIFTKIINGDIPSFKLYEDDYVFAFLDIRPVKPGHTLIVPKVEVDYFVDVPEPYYSAVFQAAKKIAPALQQATGCQRVCTTIVGYEVPHFHYHLVPTNSIADFYNKNTQEEPDMAALQAMHEKIISFL